MATGNCRWLYLSTSTLSCCWSKMVLVCSSGSSSMRNSSVGKDVVLSFDHPLSVTPSLKDANCSMESSLKNYFLNRILKLLSPKWSQRRSREINYKMFFSAINAPIKSFNWYKRKWSINIYDQTNSRNNFNNHEFLGAFFFASAERPRAFEVNQVADPGAQLARYNT